MTTRPLLLPRSRTEPALSHPRSSHLQMAKTLEGLVKHIDMEAQKAEKSSLKTYGLLSFLFSLFFLFSFFTGGTHSWASQKTLYVAPHAHILHPSQWEHQTLFSALWWSETFPQTWIFGQSVGIPGPWWFFHHFRSSCSLMDINVWWSSLYTAFTLTKVKPCSGVISTEFSLVFSLVYLVFINLKVAFYNAAAAHQGLIWSNI